MQKMLNLSKNTQKQNATVPAIVELNANEIKAVAGGGIISKPRHTNTKSSDAEYSFY
jgi:hypothetical protein